MNTVVHIRINFTNLNKKHISISYATDDSEHSRGVLKGGGEANCNELTAQQHVVQNIPPPPDNTMAVSLVLTILH